MDQPFNLCGLLFFSSLLSISAPASGQKAYGQTGSYTIFETPAFCATSGKIGTGDQDTYLFIYLFTDNDGKTVRISLGGNNWPLQRSGPLSGTYFTVNGEEFRPGLSGDGYSENAMGAGHFFEGNAIVGKFGYDFLDALAKSDQLRLSRNGVDSAVNVQIPDLPQIASMMKQCAAGLEQPKVEAEAEIRRKPSTRQRGWSYVLSPINPATEDSDGTIRAWHSRIGSNSYPTEKACIEAAKKGLEYLAGEAWNFEASCTSPPRTSMPIAIATIDVRESEIDGNAVAHQTKKLQQTVIVAPPPIIIAPAFPEPKKDADPDEPMASRSPVRPKYLSMIVGRIFFPPKEKVTIAPDKRTDLSSCDASEGAAMLTALENCWPILQSYQALGEVMRGIADHSMAEALEDESADDSELQMQTRTLKGADEVISLASERKWPLQDLILIMAHSMKREIYENLKKYDLALEQLAITESIAKTSRMTTPGFDSLENGSAIRKKLLHMKEMAVHTE